MCVCVYEQLAQGCYLTVERPGVEPATLELPVQLGDVYLCDVGVL